jgi:hypothetical protein
MNLTPTLEDLNKAKCLLAGVINANMQEFSGQVGTGKVCWYNTALDAMGSLSVAIQQLNAPKATESPRIALLGIGSPLKFIKSIKGRSNEHVKDK